MAELDAAVSLPTARQQLMAIAWLRVRLFVNVFRRKSGASVVATVFGALLIGVIACIVLGSFVFMFGFGSYAAVARGHLEALALEFWAIFLMWQFFPLGAGAAANVTAQRFDPVTLIRFPLTYSRFLAVTFVSSAMTFGVLLVGAIFTAMTVGIGLANSTLVLRAIVALVLFGLFNLLLSRALQVWIARWMSTRLAREIFSFVSVLIVIGTQLLRFRFFHGPMLSSYSAVLNGPLHPVLALLPPSLATSFVLNGPITALAGLVASIAVAFAIYSWRIRKQFYGEDLSESPIPRAKAGKKSATPIAIPSGATGTRTVSPLSACLRKEWINLRRNTALFYNGLMPLFFVVLFSMKSNLFTHHADYALLTAVSYAMLNLLATVYNIFGMEGPGIQFHLFAPRGLRQAVLAKNIVTMVFLIVDAALAIGVISFLGKNNVSSFALATTGIWVVFLIFINLTVGMLRSVYSPVKVDLTKLTVGRRNQMNGGANGFIVLGMTIGTIALGIGIMALCHFLGYPRLPLLVFALLAVGAIGLYIAVLGRIEQTIQSRSERLMDALCRA